MRTITVEQDEYLKLKSDVDLCRTQLVLLGKELEKLIKICEDNNTKEELSRLILQFDI
jgi:hypothetical protein